MRAGFGMLVLSVGVIACGGRAQNEFPETFRGRYEFVRLMGMDNATIIVGANSIGMEGCEVNCPDPTLPFTSIECTADTCTVQGADCTGTISLSTRGQERYVSMSLTAVPGATGEAAEHRQVNCFQYGGSTEWAQ